MSQQIHSSSRTVTHAGTPVRLSATRKEARWVHVYAKFDNQGDVYIRGVGEPGGLTLGGQSSFLFPPMGALPHYDLKEIELDAAVDGDGVDLLWYSGD